MSTAYQYQPSVQYLYGVYPDSHLFPVRPEDRRVYRFEIHARDNEGCSFRREGEYRPCGGFDPAALDKAGAKGLVTWFTPDYDAETIRVFWREEDATAYAESAQ